MNDRRTFLLYRGLSRADLSDLRLEVTSPFTLQPTNGCASAPLPLNFNLVFASDGTLLPESSVSLFQPS